jgi:hypothetical protein
VYDHLLKHSIRVRGILYDMLTSLKHIEAVFWNIMALTARKNTAVAMEDISYGIILCSNGKCCLRSIAYILEEYCCLSLLGATVLLVIVHNRVF